MTFLNDHPTLTSLYLHTPISDETIRRLARLQHTQPLTFVSYTNEAAANISETIYSETDWPESVTRLTFEGLNVSPRDRDLVHFAKLSKIAFLNLTGGPNAHYTAEGIAKFRELRPDVQVLVDGK